VKAARLIALLAVAAGVVLAIPYRDGLDPRAIRNALAAHPPPPPVFLPPPGAAPPPFVARTGPGVAAGGGVGRVSGLDASPGIGRMVERAEHGGWRAVAILRLTPVPHSVANTVLAMTNLKWRDYLLGSFAGMVPMTLAQVDIGASGSAILDGGQWLLACLMLAVGLAATFLLKRFSQGSQPPDGTLD